MKRMKLSIYHKSLLLYFSFFSKINWDLKYILISFLKNTFNMNFTQRYILFIPSLLFLISIPSEPIYCFLCEPFSYSCWDSGLLALVEVLCLHPRLQWICNECKTGVLCLYYYRFSLALGILLAPLRWLSLSCG